MNQKIKNMWIRSIFSLLIGILLVAYPGTASIYFVMLIGAMFLIPGIISIFNYLLNKQATRSFPIGGLGTLLFGLWLLITPGMFVTILMYMLGAVLVLAGMNMIVGLVNMRKHTPVSAGFYIVPLLVLIAGIVVLFNPFKTAELPFIVLGVSAVVYGVSGMFNAYRFRRFRNNDIEDATIISEEHDTVIKIEDKKNANDNV